MSRLFLLFSHQLQNEQKVDAQTNWGITDFVPLPDTLLSDFRSVPPELPSIKEYAAPFLRWLLEKKIQSDDYVLIQGEYGLTHYLVKWGQAQHWNVIYATTPRQVTSEVEKDGLIITRTFQYVRFRRYE